MKKVTPGDRLKTIEICLKYGKIIPPLSLLTHIMMACLKTS